MRYVTRRYEVEAQQVTAENARELAAWCGGEAYQRYFMGDPQTMVVCVPQPQGEPLEAVEGDWVLGREGVFWRLHDATFQVQYEPVAPF